MVEVTVTYKVPRDQAEGWVKMRRAGLNDGELLPPNYRCVDAKVRPDAEGATSRIIDAIYRPVS